MKHHLLLMLNTSEKYFSYILGKSIFQFSEGYSAVAYVKYRVEFS